MGSLRSRIGNTTSECIDDIGSGTHLLPRVHFAKEYLRDCFERHGDVYSTPQMILDRNALDVRVNDTKIASQSRVEAIK